MSFLICPFLASLWLSLGFLPASRALGAFGSLGGIYSAMEGRRRRRKAHGASFTITWKFPARSRIRADAISCAGV